MHDHGNIFRGNHQNIVDEVTDEHKSNRVSVKLEETNNFGEIIKSTYKSN